MTRYPVPPVHIDWDRPIDDQRLRHDYLNYLGEGIFGVQGCPDHPVGSLLSFTEWLLAQSDGYLYAFGVRTASDVKTAIVGWRQWERKMRR
jgi:hypothetical protein